MTRRTAPVDGRRERGATVVETILVTPVLFLLVLGIFEFGLVYRDVLTTSDAVADAARAGAVAGPRPTADGFNADYVIVRSLREGLGSMPTEWVDRIVVFRAGPPSAGDPADQVPAACTAGVSVPGVCNSYDAQTVFGIVSSTGDEVAKLFTCGVAGVSSGVSCAWDPFTRSNGPTVLDIDYLGVWVRIERPYLTQLFGDTFTIEEARVVRLEAGVLE